MFLPLKVTLKEKLGILLSKSSTKGFPSTNSTRAGRVAAWKCRGVTLNLKKIKHISIDVSVSIASMGTKEKLHTCGQSQHKLLGP